MVVLSAAVCTKSGRALLSRQYVEMSRLRVEGLLNAFPKLVASETSGGSSQKQHTFVETDNVCVRPAPPRPACRAAGCVRARCASGRAPPAPCAAPASACPASLCLLTLSSRTLPRAPRQPLRVPAP